MTRALLVTLQPSIKFNIFACTGLRDLGALCCINSTVVAGVSLDDIWTMHFVMQYPAVARLAPKGQARAWFADMIRSSRPPSLQEIVIAVDITQDGRLIFSACFDVSHLLTGTNDSPNSCLVVEAANTVAGCEVKLHHFNRFYNVYRNRGAELDNLDCVLCVVHRQRGVIARGRRPSCKKNVIWIDQSGGLLESDVFFLYMFELEPCDATEDYAELQVGVSLSPLPSVDVVGETILSCALSGELKFSLPPLESGHSTCPTVEQLLRAFFRPRCS